MKVFRYINVQLFLISLFIGLFFVYVTMPDTRKIYVYPTTENKDVIQYRDESGTCFSIQETEKTCPKDESLLSRIPIQTTQTSNNSVVGATTTGSSSGLWGSFV